MRNIIDAIYEVVTNSHVINDDFTHSTNRVNSVGEALEEYIKSIFAGTVNSKNQSKRDKINSEIFSYLGNTNNPPDSMIRGGDAIEVKKIQSKDSALALNSSYPKAKLFANSPMISVACRECEDWSVRDMLYCVGVVKGRDLKSLAMVYGDDYCADKERYERIKRQIKYGVESIPDIEFAETQELGRVNRVDPLGITYLRVRGMWGIENPFKVFQDYYKIDDKADFNLMVVINREKLNTFNNVHTLYNLQREHEYFDISDVKIKNPNNPAQLRDAILVTYKVL